MKTQKQLKIVIKKIDKLVQGDFKGSELVNVSDDSINYIYETIIDSISECEDNSTIKTQLEYIYKNIDKVVKFGNLNIIKELENICINLNKRLLDTAA